MVNLTKINFGRMMERIAMVTVEALLVCTFLGLATHLILRRYQTYDRFTLLVTSLAILS